MGWQIRRLEAVKHFTTISYIDSATVTITAADPDGLQANQGFNVEVGSDAGQPATVTIFGLREVDDRTQAVDPSDVSGNISVLLDVQYNDETVTNVDLTLGDEVVSCRGASSDAASPAGVVPGVAESGGSVEIECFFDTDQVAGECMGMQLEPRFANGEHELGARITTSDGTTRDALATQMITLKNTNYVMIDHNPGSVSHIVGGVTFYGGPTTEDNVNTFDVCPVAFDGTMVGKIGLRGMTDTVQEDGDSYNDDLSFRTHRSGRYGEYNGVRRVDDEAPFTFTVLSSQNAYTEDRNADGHGGHWIIQDGTISDPDGLDISSKFMPGDMENDLTKIGPIYFDFASPRVSGDSEVTIEGASIMNVHYSGKRSTYDGRSQRFGVSGVTERGAGGVADVIAVGDCSVRANTDTGRDGAGTAFQAIVEDAAAVGDLPEDDPDAGNLSDDGGVQCYTAELQALRDRMGNSRSLSRVRIQSAEFFGVDKTAPEIDDVEPDEELVLMDAADLTFEVEDPELETGEAGSGFNGAATRAYWGTSWSNRYFRTGYGDATDPGNVIAEDGGVVTIETNTGVAAADREQRHVVNVEVRDNAVPPNLGNVSFAYTRDAKAPTVSLSKSQSDIGNVGTSTVTVSVGGTISDKNVIKRADLSIREKVGDATCMASTDLEAGTGKPVVRNKRDLENDTNSIVFDESFTLRAAEGDKTYCFWLATADVAVEANGRGTGNEKAYELGSFEVSWPAGTPPPPPGPTFKFHAAGAVTELDSLSVIEGASDSTYRVTLDRVPTGQTFPLAMTIDPSSRLVTTSVSAGTAGATAGQFGAATDTLTVTVTTNHDLDINSERRTLTHKAKDFDDTRFLVLVKDDDLMISANTSSLRENDDPAEVTLTVRAGLGAEIGAAVSVALAPRAGTTTTADDFVAGTWDVTIPAATRMKDTVVMVDAVDDAIQNEMNEAIQVQGPNSVTTTGAAYVMPAYIAIHDDDPDITLSVNHDEVNEDAGEVTVTITATAKRELAGITTVSLAAVASADGANNIDASTAEGTDYTLAPSPVILTFSGSTTATAEVTLTVTDDTTDEANETIVLWDSDGGAVVGSTDTPTVQPVTITIMDNDDS
ncbi:hypothetical protein [Candidatus Palauibacter sp.]|uniref:hypothetical protein n=1 Tax=Candidatus Palauibacter sp. TaxID=3101350 RepID=UPI003B012556